MLAVKMEEQSDAVLLAACERGDAAAWEALVTRYQRLIWSIPLRAGLDEDAAGDVFQQVWATLLEHLPRLTQPDRVGAWLVTTTRRATWRHGKGLHGAGPLPPDNADPIPDAAPLPGEALEALETQHGVRTALARLDERCRQLLTLLFYTDAPPAYSEVAARVGLREGSIGPTRARCLEKLRGLLDEPG